jgi:competence protein ComEC
MIGKDNFKPLDWGQEISAEIIYSYPGESWSGTGLGSGNTLINNSSIVLRLEYGDHSFLFMGDAEGKDRNSDPEVAKYVEKILLETTVSDKLKATVIKAGHHGSESSSSLPFIRAVDPEIVVVLSGRKSFSGTYLPDESTLRLYCCQNSGIRIYRTDYDDEKDGLKPPHYKDGDHVVIETNGREIRVIAHSASVPIEVGECVPGCE